MHLFGDRGGDIAAVIVEPIAGNMGVVPADAAFLQALRHLTTQWGALLVFDEVITGFRVALGGAESLYGIRPDLTTLGKIIGGGLPVGAYGGPEEIMNLLAPVGPVYQAGTLSGNPIATAAGVITRQHLMDDEFFVRLDRTTQRLAEGLREAARLTGTRATVNACTGLLTLFFADGPIRDLADAQCSDVSMYRRFFHAMLDRGISLPPSQYEAWMLSSVHSDGDVDRTIDAARDSMIEIQGDAS